MYPSFPFTLIFTLSQVYPSAFVTPASNTYNVVLVIYNVAVLPLVVGLFLKFVFLANVFNTGVFEVVG